MKIVKKRIVNVQNYLHSISDGQEFYVSFTDLQNNINKVNRIGFSQSLFIGEKILPNIIGSISRFNANVKFLIRRDLPKETIYIEREWVWKDWGGNEHSKIVYIPRERYPRDFISPPSEEFLIDNYKENKIIISKRLVKNSQNFEEIKHIINLFLEYFGECDLVKDDYSPFIADNIIRLNWKILPQGNYPWEKVKEATRQRLQRETNNRKAVIENNLEVISSFTPDFVAVGQGGFNDYIVFGFPNKNLYILESIKSGNATYVFNSNWEQLSRLTKAEILNNNLHQSRVFHTPSWKEDMNRILQ